jgi:cell division protease FtsH
MLLPGSDPVQKVSIIPRGVGVLGYTIQRPIEDRFLMTAQELEHKMVVLLGGRAAEQLVFGQLSTGAADDLARVTDIARAMVTRYGMHERLGAVSYAPERPSLLGTPQVPAPPEYGPQTAQEIDGAVRELVAASLERALALLRAQRGALERGAELLLARETLREEELSALRASLPAPAGAATGGAVCTVSTAAP